MGVHLKIPDSVAQAIRLPEHRLRKELLGELAVAPYQHELLSFGKARELAGLEPRDFAKLLGDRGVARHYGDEELGDDLAYAR